MCQLPCFDYEMNDPLQKFMRLQNSLSISRNSLPALGLALLAGILSAGSLCAAKRPNILWIVGENLKLDLGCYGAKNVKTPNLDGLRRRVSVTRGCSPLRRFVPPADRRS